MSDFDLEGLIPLLIVPLLALGSSARAGECSNWEADHPEWIFCDDFEDGGALVGPGRYFEYDDDQGDFVRLAGAGLDGSHGMRALWQPGEVSAGSLKLAFGRNPNAYMDQGIRSTEDFRQIYYRMYLRMQPDWQGDPAKLSRATIFVSSSSWIQAMIAHLWSSQNRLVVDPARCVDENSQVKCTTYNDGQNLDWLGAQAGTTRIFDTSEAGRWLCVEAHVALNDPGSANGVQEFWMDGQLEARRDQLDFVRSYADYALNAIFFENYWNDGSPTLQERYFDNIVVSTQPIGCIPRAQCADGIDNDGDGGIDYDPVTAEDPQQGSGDPGCRDPDWPLENPQCQDGINNDSFSDGTIDFDGGASLDQDDDGFVDSQFNTDQPAVTAPDPQCVGNPWKNKERSGCGVGAELPPALLGLIGAHQRRRTMSRRKTGSLSVRA